MTVTLNRPASAPPRARSETIEFARVAIGGTTFALPLAAIATILPAAAVRRRDEPGLWHGDAGAREGGGAIPVAAGRALFGDDGSPAPVGHAVILRGSPPFGLLVDVVLGTTATPVGGLERLSPLFGAPERLLVRAVIAGPEGLDLVIDPPTLRRAPRNDTPPPPAAVETLADLLAAPPEGDWLEARFGAGEALWRLPIACVRQISEPRPAARLPRASAAIQGVLTWRGRPLPLVDTALTLALAPAPPAAFIVVGPPSRPGAPADDALLTLTATAIAGVAPAGSPTPALDLADFVRRIG